MRRHLDAGVSAAEAARLALARPRARGQRPAQSAGLPRLSEELSDALDRLDEPGAQASFDRLLATFTLETVLRDVVLPYLHELGERWERGEVTVAQEHFASNVLRGRLLGLARGWGRGTGPRAVLACAPGELHDLSLIIFGLVLAGRGWVITYLGPDTPISTIKEAVPDPGPRPRGDHGGDTAASPRSAARADRAGTAGSGGACRLGCNGRARSRNGAPPCSRAIRSRPPSTSPTSIDDPARRPPTRNVELEPVSVTVRGVRVGSARRASGAGGRVRRGRRKAAGAGVLAPAGAFDTWSRSRPPCGRCTGAPVARSRPRAAALRAARARGALGLGQLSLSDPRRRAGTDAGRLDLLHTDRRGPRGGALGDQRLLPPPRRTPPPASLERRALSADPGPAARRAGSAVLCATPSRTPAGEDRGVGRKRHRWPSARSVACEAARRRRRVAPAPQLDPRPPVGSCRRDRRRRRPESLRGRGGRLLPRPFARHPRLCGTRPRRGRDRRQGGRSNGPAPAGLPGRSRRRLARALPSSAQPGRDGRPFSRPGPCR